MPLSPCVALTTEMSAKGANKRDERERNNSWAKSMCKGNILYESAFLYNFVFGVSFLRQVMSTGVWCLVFGVTEFVQSERTQITQSIGEDVCE